MTLHSCQKVVFRKICIVDLERKEKVLEKKYPVNTAVWIATALLAAEKYENDPLCSKRDMYFKQKVILHRAQELAEGTVASARCSQWCCADNSNSSNNYLRGDLREDPSLRRLSLMKEFAEKTYPENLEMSDELMMNGNLITMEELFHFVREQYPAIINSEKVEYYPSLTEYNPGITAEEYERILGDENIVKLAWLDTLHYLYLMGGIGSCKQIANKYGNGAAHYNTNAINIAKAVYKETKCPLRARDTGENQYWPVLFYGRDLADSAEGVFSYKMREPLMEAIKALEGKGVFREVNEVETNIKYDKNLILYGPPGTGKTYNSATYAVAICDGKSVNELTDYNAVMKRYNELKETGRIAFTTFHQSYGYEEFIEGIKPVVDDEATDISYTIESGVFKKFCDVAGTPENMEIDHNVQVWNEKPYVFIIDEINRGNISKIFGELITLIESTKRAGMEEAASAILPYSGKPFSVPSNVYILGTMNTADRSIALMDTALRRRFQFVEMMPDSDVLRKIHADKVEDLDVAAVLDKINERITFLYDREHTIGHAFFTGLKDDASLAKLQSIFEKSVIPLLQEYFYEDYQKIQLVLGDNAKSDDSLKFILDEKVVAKNIFKGNAEDVIDLPEKRYSINKVAFGNINSYKEIL